MKIISQYQLILWMGSGLTAGIAIALTDMEHHNRLNGQISRPRKDNQMDRIMRGIQEAMARSVNYNPNLDIKVLKSAAGYYIGQADARGPWSRISQEYYQTKAEADEALESGRFSLRYYP